MVDPSLVQELVMARRRQDPLERPVSMYEVHASSWRRGLGWRADYVAKLPAANGVVSGGSIAMPYSSPTC